MTDPNPPADLTPVDQIPTHELLAAVGHAETMLGGLEQLTGQWRVRLGLLKIRLWQQTADEMLAQAKAAAATEAEGATKQ